MAPSGLRNCRRPPLTRVSATLRCLIKIAERGEEGVLLFVERGVAGLWQHHETRSWDEGAVGLAEFGGHEAVVGTPYEQGRHVDAVQPLRQRRIVEARAVGEARDGRAVFRD